MTALTDLPQFHSLALDEIPAPDYADVQIVPIPPELIMEPQDWAARLFDFRSAPAWVVGAMAVRQSLIGLIGISQGDHSAFAVQRVVGEEALINTDDRHLQFCCGVAVDAERLLLRVTTTVRLKGWRGRVYFAPVAILHGPVVRSMMIKAARRPS